MSVCCRMMNPNEPSRGRFVLYSTIAVIALRGNDINMTRYITIHKHL